MNLLTLLLIVLLIIAIGGGGWGYRAGWYGPTYPYFGPGIGAIILVLIILLVLGYIR